MEKQKEAVTIFEERFKASEIDRRINRMVWYAVIGICSGILGIFLSLYATFKPLKIIYIATYDDGKILELHPLSQPIYSDLMVSQWTTDALLNTFNYSYFNWQNHFQNVTRSYFTKDCMTSLFNSFKDNGNLEQLKAGKLLVKSVITQSPFVIRTHFISNPVTGIKTYQWNLVTKLLMTVTNGKQINTGTYDVFVVIERVNELSNPYGLRITQLNVNRVDE